MKREARAVGSAHLTGNGRFQSDKYPTVPEGKVPLSTRDPLAQDLLWKYAGRHETERKHGDSDFPRDLRQALLNDGYKPPTNEVAGLHYWTRTLEKMLTDRVNIVLTDPDMMAVYRRFGGAIFRRSSVFHGLKRFLTECDVKGKVAFEVGTWNGLTAVVLSRFFKRVITVDIVENPEKHKVLAELGIDNVRCFHVRDNDDKAKIARRFDFDFAYLDGNHADDTRFDWQMVKHCRRVLFQEVWPFQAPVWELVHALPPDEVRYGGDGLALWDAR